MKTYAYRSFNFKVVHETKKHISLMLSQIQRIAVTY